MCFSRFFQAAQSFFFRQIDIEPETDADGKEVPLHAEL
jgi:hypothetical protein